MDRLIPRFLATVLGAALLIAGCGPAVDGDDAPPPSDPATETTDTAPPQQDDDAGTGADEADPPTGDDAAPDLPLLALGAVEVALAHTPGAVVELDREPTVWEVVVLADGDGVELYIDIDSGEVTRERARMLSPVQRTAPAVTAGEAIGIALTETPGELWELDLGTERGTTVWEAMVTAEAGGEWELYISAETGEILKVERD